MLATLTDARFSSADWIFERKLDGVRCLAFRAARRVRLLSRRRQDMNATWPELVAALERQRGAFVADGEIVAFSGGGTSFERLQQRLGIHDADEARRSPVGVYYYLFDLLHLDGYDLTALPQRVRKHLLKAAITFRDPLRYTPHRNRDGERLAREACRRRWEGLIAKRAAAPYRHGRSRDWLKFKCAEGQEMVVGGYTDPHGSRVGFGALLLGYYRHGRLRYAGKVGTGWDDATLRKLAARLRRLERGTAPFTPAPSERGVHWVTPRLVAEIGFTEWTDDGKLRHPRFLGLRTDKAARDVERERPVPHSRLHRGRP